MRVIATRTGYSDTVRQPGDVFEVPDGLTGSWFEAVPEGAADSPEPGQPAPERKGRKNAG